MTSREVTIGSEGIAVFLPASAVGLLAIVCHSHSLSLGDKGAAWTSRRATALLLDRITGWSRMDLSRPPMLSDRRRIVPRCA